MRLPWLEDLEGVFPPVAAACSEPNGLLCAGGDLSPHTLLAAYRHGVFPWFEDDQPILWWSPDPRMIIELEGFKPSRSLTKLLRRGVFQVSVDTCFSDVIEACAAPRGADTGTWITAEMQAAYCDLWALGHAHSIEVWEGDALVGGLYGIAIGHQFFGESMFSRASNASKVGLATLATQLNRWGFEFLDCQVANPHLESLGAIEIPRAAFIARIASTCERARTPGHWALDADLGGGVKP
jgi:leucyl/phenylalanyl-tRNA--protein transferase